MVLLKNDLPLFYFLLQSLVCQYLEDRPLLHRYYKVWPAVHKKKRSIITDSLYISLTILFISLQFMLALFLQIACSVKSSTHSTPARLWALSNKKENTDFFFKEMVVLLCLVKTFKNSTKIYHQSEDRLCSSIALQARTLLSWPTQSTALNGTG